MTVGFNTFIPKSVNTEFIVKNISVEGKTVTIFNLNLKYNNSYDLLSIDYVSEADIQHSLLKGSLRTKLLNRELIVTSSNINLVQFGSDQKEFLESVGITDGINPGSGGGGSSWTVSAIQTSDYTASIYETVVYDPSGGTFTIDAPATVSAGDQFRVKNFSSDITPITIDGNGNNIEDPFASFALAATISFGGDGVTSTWEYDGTQWLCVNSV